MTALVLAQPGAFACRAVRLLRRCDTAGWLAVSHDGSARVRRQYGLVLHHHDSLQGVEQRPWL